MPKMPQRHTGLRWNAQLGLPAMRLHIRRLFYLIKQQAPRWGASKITGGTYNV